MDTELARTFLTVVAAGNFVSAAERLHVSQSTVSTRIHALESYLGCTLFVRNKAGTALTAAGRQFQRHAATLVRTVEQARHDVGIPKGFSGTLAIGGRIGLWEEFLLHWLPAMREHRPTLAIHIESGLEPEIMRGLIEGRIDIGVLYTPQSRPGLKVEKLFDEQLIMVSTDPHAPPEPRDNYVYVEWGPEFYARHSVSFPNFGGAALAANIGWLGLQHILNNGGSGYFPRRIVLPHLAAGTLHAIASAPSFYLPAYVIYPAEHDADVFGNALALMHEVARRNTRERADSEDVSQIA